MEKLRNIGWRKVYCLITFAMVLLIFEIAATRLLAMYNLEKFWIAIPLIMYPACLLASKVAKRLFSVAISIEGASIIAFMLLAMIISKQSLNSWVEKNFNTITIVTILSYWVSLLISKQSAKDIKIMTKSDTANKLFNLFYLNTSKAHEIAMLIDNKIMKAIEQEQVSEELLKNSTSIVVGRKDNVVAEASYSTEDSNKKRVYESFDVKTTKSIMLRKIYETTQKNKGRNNGLRVGDLAIFENIELKQVNVDDTVMILNILQDSKINNQSNDNLEINLNKMMDKMLDDFTIDYTFDYKTDKKDEYIIQIPYKVTSNFENGYQHNDLQLGRLSLIGIYRGEIDFSKRISISSKFLELVSESYNQETNQTNNTSGLKLSYASSNAADIQLEFHHKRLEKKLHLIDVIAIIQELNLGKDD